MVPLFILSGGPPLLSNHQNLNALFKNNQIKYMKFVQKSSKPHQVRRATAEHLW